MKNTFKTLFLFMILMSCKKENDKVKIEDSNAIANYESCFKKENLKNREDDYLFVFEDNNFKLKHNTDDKYDLIINEKEYLTNLLLVSSEINFYSYTCNKDNILIIEGDDYYSSIFFVYYFENDNLSYLGNFYIEQPDIESTGVPKKDFLIKKNNKFKIQLLLNDIIKSENKFSIRDKIKQKENLVENKIDFSLVGKWVNTDCDSLIGIMIENDSTIIMCIEPNQYYIYLNRVNKENNIVKYKLKGMQGIGSKEVFSEVYMNDNIIAEFKIINNNRIQFNWLGLYNKTNNKRQYVEPLISDENPTTLIRCNY